MQRIQFSSDPDLTLHAESFQPADPEPKLQQSHADELRLVESMPPNAELEYLALRQRQLNQEMLDVNRRLRELNPGFVHQPSQNQPPETSRCSTNTPQAAYKCSLTDIPTCSTVHKEIPNSDTCRIPLYDAPFLPEKVSHHCSPVNPCPPAVNDQVSNPHSGNLPQLLNMVMGLPQKEIPRFYGDPIDYWRFYNAFTHGIAQYTNDTANCLDYLITYCEGSARKAIEHCTILDPKEGYAEAWRILKENFGEPHKIAQKFMASLMDGPIIRPDDETGLRSLAQSMKACEVTLKQLGFVAELNTQTMMSAVVARLPIQMQNKWYETASAILRNARLPQFNELTQFVRERAEIASAKQMYALRTNTNQFDRRGNVKDPVSNQKLCTLNVVSDDSPGETSFRPSCNKCGARHYLDQCPSFRALSLYQRKVYIADNILCTLCLKPKHQASQCRTRKTCGLNQCNKQHHPLLHDVSEGSAYSGRDADTERSKATINTGTVRNENGSVSLGVIPVKLKGPKGVIIVNALLDTGSDATLLSKAVMEKLGLDGDLKTLSLTTLHGERRTDAFRVNLSIGPVNSDNMQTVKAWAVDHLPSVTSLVPEREQRQEWQHLHSLELPTPCPGPIAILIGMDIPSAHWVYESKFGGTQDPYAVRTPFGWIVLGPLNAKRSARVISNNVSLTEEETLAKFESAYQMEFSELSSTQRGDSREDGLALSTVQNAVTLVDGHYQIPLPWRSGCPSLRSNRQMALRRLQQLATRLKRDVLLKELYTTALQGYLNRGYAERIPHSLVHTKEAWYLPHHPVFHPNKPNKVRVVFDCACNFDGMCLNSQLLSGPDVGNNLFGVLLRFRQAPFVFTADVEAMFHQVKVPAEQRRYLRFLWWENGDLTNAPADYQMTAHPFGATSSPFCAGFALNQALDDNSKLFNNGDASEAKRSFYVDDCLCSSDSIPHLLQLASQLTTALYAGGFRLVKWSSNVPQLLHEIPVADRALYNPSLDCQPNDMNRMLGVEWDMANDAIVFRVSPFKEKLTRRKMLSYVASIYDPLGFVSPAILPGRLMLQTLNQKKIDWDEEIDEEQAVQWCHWVEGLQSIGELRITRCLTFPDAEKQTFQLHCFSDASERAFGAVVYLRAATLAGEVQCRLVCGKSRVAPVKGITIPRLELTAAVLAVRLATQVQRECTLSLESTTFWTDSMIVLQTIRNTSSRFRVFVANRLAVIHELSTPEQWRYINGLENPADMASRGATVDKMMRSDWFMGPTFLKENHDMWPRESEKSTSLSDTSDSARILAIDVKGIEISWFERFSRFGSWNGLLRAIAWLRRFCVYLQNKRTPHPNFSRCLSSEELTKAALCVTKLVQASAFPQELRSLSQEKDGVKHSLVSSVSPLRKLNPFIDNGLIRVGGRLRWALIPYETKHPAILPRRHFATRLLIQYHHIRAGHVGAAHVLADIRSKYWVLQGQAAIRSVISACQFCRRWFSLPCNQIMAPLPLDRTNVSSKPFALTGVDYFGPFLVKRGRTTEKRYGCLFTCLSIRAVHIEVTDKLDTDSFLGAFSRFVARRGNPVRVYSDNGMNFRGAEADVKECLKSWDQDRIAQRLLENECDWIFMVPKASHRGGVWERQIRSIRRILRGLLGERLVDDQTLLTSLAEVEKILNDRPLVKLTSDPDDCAAITPSHLLLLHRNPAIMPQNITSSRLNNAWRNAQQLADNFWKRWRREYLPSLMTCQKWLARGRNLDVGDLVLLVDTNAPRGQWLKGVIEDPLVSADGVVRQARVKTAQGRFLRDVRQLCLLEAHEEFEQVSARQLNAETSDGQNKERTHAQ